MRDSPVLVIAVLSNIVVSASGVLYFAAVRNATRQGDGCGWERTIIAVDPDGEVLWQYPPTGDLLDPSPRLQSGQDLQTFSIAVSDTAVVFCGLRPRNTTVDGDIGFGAVDATGGQLVSSDASATVRTAKRLLQLLLPPPRQPLVLVDLPSEGIQKRSIIAEACLHAPADSTICGRDNGRRRTRGASSGAQRTETPSLRSTHHCVDASLLTPLLLLLPPFTLPPPRSCGATP